MNQSKRVTSTNASFREEGVGDDERAGNDGGIETTQDSSSMGKQSLHDFNVDDYKSLEVCFRFLWIWVVFGYVLVPAYATFMDIDPKGLSPDEIAFGVLFAELGKIITANAMLSSELGENAPLRRWSDAPANDDGNNNVKIGLVFGSLACVVARLVDSLSDTGDAGGAVGIFGPILNGTTGTSVDVFCIIVASVIIAPLTEELFFRGFLLEATRRRFQRGRSISNFESIEVSKGYIGSEEQFSLAPDVLAVVLVSMMFAGVHFQPSDFPELFVCGLCFGGAALVGSRKRNRAISLTAPIVAHMTFNASVIIEQVGMSN